MAAAKAATITNNQGEKTMKTNTKIFKVEDRKTGSVRLVDASSASAALQHVVAVSVASARDVADAMAQGATVETVGVTGNESNT
jgi:hypothetical protein